MSIEEINHEKIAILVISCDNYSDLWRPFFECFERFWSDCPYSVYLVNNHKEVKYKNVKVVHVGDDISWSDNLKNALQQVPHDYIFLHIEDLFLNAPVDSKEIQRIFDWAVENNVNYIKMSHGYHKSIKPFNESVNIIPKGSLYRTSVVLCLFRKTVLMDLLTSGESAWEFEVHGSERSDKYEDFYIARQQQFSTTNTIIKRKWQRPAVKKIRQLGIGIDLSERQVMTRWEDVKFRLLLFRAWLSSFISPSLKRKTKKMLGGGRY